MYESFFGMEHTPFVRDVPADKLYESNAFRETLGRLAYVADRQKFAVVTADPGCGKSTLIRRFYEELPKSEYIILYLSDSKRLQDGSIKDFWISWAWNPASIGGIPNASCSNRLKSSVEYSTKKSSVFLMKHICWKKKHWKNFDFF